MKQSLVKLWILTSVVFFLASCFSPTTPQEVTRTFWDAVINNDPGDITEYSTLTDPDKHNGFSMDWNGYQPSWGKVVIEGNRASIDSEFFSPAKSGRANRIVTTYLVRLNEEWKVDYDRTNKALHGGAIGNLFNKLSQLRDDFSRQWADSADDFNAEMDRMSRKLEEITGEYGQQSSETIDRYAEELRDSIKKLEESINRALQDKDSNLSDRDRQMLVEVSEDLAEDEASLSNPDAGTIVNTSRNSGEAQRKLQSLDNASLAEYRQEWRQLGEQFENEIRQLLAELSATAETYSTGR